MQRRAHYSTDELAAFLLADLLGDMLTDGLAPSSAQLRNAQELLGRLGCAGEKSRHQLCEALQGLSEKNAKKRAALRARLTSE